MNTLKISVITISRNEAWSLAKTARSVISQNYTNIEYIIVDGGSEDGSAELCEFLLENQLITRYVHEKDEGVYHAMSKGGGLATGEYICFLNSGDVFDDSETISKVATQAQLLCYPDCLIGWGTVGKQIWATWITDIPAVRMGSLGFCHQALFIKREVFRETPFRDYATTDNDTYQLADIIASGKRVEIISSIIVNRDPNPGLSAYSTKSTASIHKTLSEYYGFTPSQCEAVLSFRRNAADSQSIISLLQADYMDDKLNERALHLAILCLDTICLRQAAGLEPDLRTRIIDAALSTIETVCGNVEVNRISDLLSQAVLRKGELVQKLSDEAKLSGEKTDALRKQLEKDPASKAQTQRLEAMQSDTCHVCITSFPARIKSLDVVVRSIIRQSIRPQKITIILGKDEFPSTGYLPSQLLELCADTVEIHFVDRTRHNYDKLFHQIQSSRVAIFDDDVIYKRNSIEKLFETSRKHPGCVVANRSHRMLLTDDREEIRPYRYWDKEKIQETPSHLVFPTGAGGVLYETAFFTTPEVRADHVILRSAPFADDVWLKVQCIMKGIKAVTTDACSSLGAWYQGYTPQMAHGALHKLNTERDLNDIQLQSCIQYAESKGIRIIELLKVEMEVK